MNTERPPAGRSLGRDGQDFGKGGFVMQEYVNMWKNYVNFSDRTTVRGYWMAFLFNFLAGLVLSILAAIVPSLGILGSLYSLAALIPGIALTMRRLRDAGRHPALILLSLIPLVGAIVLIVFLCGASVPDDGRPVV